MMAGTRDLISPDPGTAADLRMRVDAAEKTFAQAEAVKAAVAGDYAAANEEAVAGVDGAEERVNALLPLVNSATVRVAVAADRVAAARRLLADAEQREAVISWRTRARRVDMLADRLGSAVVHYERELARVASIGAEAMAAFDALALAAPEGTAGLKRIKGEWGERIASVHVLALPRPITPISYRPERAPEDIAGRLRRDVDAELCKAGVISPASLTPAAGNAA